MTDYLILTFTFVTISPFLHQVIVDGPMKVFPIQVEYGVAFQHPFFLCDIICAKLSRVFHNPVKNPAMN